MCEAALNELDCADDGIPCLVGFSYAGQADEADTVLVFDVAFHDSDADLIPVAGCSQGDTSTECASGKLRISLNGEVADGGADCSVGQPGYIPEVIDTMLPPFARAGVLDVGVGANHFCAIGVASSAESAGALACVGDNSAGQLNAPGGNTYIDVDAGQDFTCARSNNGALTCWGDNSLGQSSPPTGTFRHLSVSASSACGLTAGGSLQCWGDLAGEMTPLSLTHLAVGDGFWCGIAEDGFLACGGSEVARLGSLPSSALTTLVAHDDALCVLTRGASSWECVGNTETIPGDALLKPYLARDFGAGFICGTRNDLAPNLVETFATQGLQRDTTTGTFSFFLELIDAEIVDQSVFEVGLQLQDRAGQRSNRIVRELQFRLP